MISTPLLYLVISFLYLCPKTRNHNGNSIRHIQQTGFKISSSAVSLHRSANIKITDRSITLIIWLQRSVVLGNLGVFVWDAIQHAPPTQTTWQSAVYPLFTTALPQLQWPFSIFEMCQNKSDSQSPQPTTHRTQKIPYQLPWSHITGHPRGSCVQTSRGQSQLRSTVAPPWNQTTNARSHWEFGGRVEASIGRVRASLIYGGPTSHPTGLKGSITNTTGHPQRSCVHVLLTQYCIHHLSSTDQICSGMSNGCFYQIYRRPGQHQPA